MGKSWWEQPPYEAEGIRFNYSIAHGTTARGWPDMALVSDEFIKYNGFLVNKESITLKDGRLVIITSDCRATYREVDRDGQLAMFALQGVFQLPDKDENLPDPPF